MNKELTKEDVQSDEIQFKIQEFIFGRMTYDEAVQFLKIIEASKVLQKEVIFHNNIRIAFKCCYAYKDLCTAYANQDSKEVIRLAEMMEELGYYEQVHPIADMVKEAKQKTNS